MNQQPNKYSPLGPYEQMERLKRELAEALAVPKHLLRKPDSSTFTQMEERCRNRFSNCLEHANGGGYLGKNCWMQKDGSIIKQCPKCLQKHTDTTVSHCEECQRKF